jgi:dihydroflavonol-4-reductase
MVGAHVVRSALDAGYAVRALLRSGYARPHLEGLPIEVVTGDLEDRASLDGAMYGVDHVIHCAGYYVKSSIGEMRQTARALVQTRNVLGAVRDANVRRLVFTSSVATIGAPRRPGDLADEDCQLDGETIGYLYGLYQRIKLAMEDEVLRAASDGLPAVVVNPAFAVGEYDMRPRSMSLLARVAASQAPFALPARASWVDARDVGQGHLLALERGQIGRRYILGGDNLTFGEMCRRVSAVAGTTAPTLELPPRLALAVAWSSELWHTLFHSDTDRAVEESLPVVTLHELLTASYVDSTRACTELGYAPRPVGGGIERAITWYRRLGYL